MPASPAPMSSGGADPTQPTPGCLEGALMIRFLAIALVTCLCGMAGTPSVEALRAGLPAGDAQARVAALLDLVNRIESRVPQDALVLAAEGVELARQVGDAEKEASFLSSTSYCHSQLGNFTLAVRFGRESLELSRKIDNKIRIASANNVLGIAYTYMGAYSQALESHLESLRIREELSLDKASIKSLNNIGIVYHNIGQYEKSLFYYQKIVEKLDKDPNTSNLILVKLNIGSAENKLGRFPEALKHLEEALKLIFEHNEKTLIAYAYLNLGITYSDLKDFEQARKYIDLSLAEYERQNQKYGRIQALNAKGRMYLLSGTYPKAIACSLEAIELAKKLNAGKELVVSYELISNIYEKQRNIPDSFKYYKLYIEAKELIYSTQEKEKIFDISEKMVTLKRDHEFELLKKERISSELRIARTQLYSTILAFSIASMIVIILLLVWYNNKIKKNKLMLEKTNLELARLNQELQDRMTEIKTLTGLLPICAQCKKIRNDEGYWEQLEGYISEHTAATFTHGICPNCAEVFFPEAMRHAPPAP